MTYKIFVDSSFFIALINTSDKDHSIAKDVYKKVIKEKWKIFITDNVIIELGDYFSKLRWREIGRNWIISILDEKETFNVISLDKTIFIESLILFMKHKDKEWGLTDCISFVTMKKHKISEVLTFDHHFEQAGFTNLIKDI
jgi:uncharacterized protein